jgi:16S rRNA (cytosine967-C5)-methyltransferase
LTPAARLQAAIDVLTALETTASPADRVLREYFRARRYAGSKDRAAVAERVFDCFRHAHSYAWRMTGSSPRAWAIASVLAEGADPAAFFTGASYAPAVLTDVEIAALAMLPPRDPPANVQGEYPAWLQPDLEEAFGADLQAEMVAMQARASVDIRVNTLKTTREALVVALASDGFDAKPTPHVVTGLRLDGAKTSKLSASPLFAAGHFEFQDEAAQMAAALCDARPGMRVLDYAAGTGGKSLALAAAMSNKGEIIAYDIDAGRLAMIGPRTERAGATIIKTGTSDPIGPFDLVLLDAPCSGTGTWRRQPELRVRFTPERLVALVALQAKLIEDASRFVAPDGRLAYATCSVLPRENDAQIAAFLRNHSEFVPIPASQADPFFHATPRRTETDGFFTAVLQRSR